MLPPSPCGQLSRGDLQRPSTAAPRASRSSLPAQAGCAGATSSAGVLVRGESDRGGVGLGERLLCVANEANPREGELLHEPAEVQAQGQKQGYLPENKQDIPPQQSPRAHGLWQPFRRCRLVVPAVPRAGSQAQRWPRRQRDVGTSPRLTSPRVLRRGSSSVGASLGCQAAPKPFKAEQETAGSTRLRVTLVTQACRHKLHPLQVTFAVTEGGLSEAG